MRFVHRKILLRISFHMICHRVLKNWPATSRRALLSARAQRERERRRRSPGKFLANPSQRSFFIFLESNKKRATSVTAIVVTRCCCIQAVTFSYTIY